MNMPVNRRATQQKASSCWDAEVSVLCAGPRAAVPTPVAWIPSSLVSCDSFFRPWVSEEERARRYQEIERYEELKARQLEQHLGRP